MSRPMRPGGEGFGGMISRLFEGLLPKQAEVTPDVQAAITVPSNEGFVPYRVACEGTHSNIPRNMELWLVVHGQLTLEETGEAFDVFYPQPAPIMRLPGGRWHSVASMGPDPKEPAGKEYDLLLIVSNRSATRQLLKYAHESSARGKWSGMFSLPRGTTVLDTVTLTRV